jgi:hypothetical protein
MPQRRARLRVEIDDEDVSPFSSARTARLVQIVDLPLPPFC